MSPPSTGARTARRSIGLTLSPAITRTLYAFGLLLATLILGHDITRSLWYDESATYQFATMSWPELWRTIHQADAFYVVHYALMHLWLVAVGTSEFAMRVPSLIFAVATLPLAWSVVKRLHSEWAGIVTAALLTFNVYYFEYATEARAYSYLMFASVALTWLMLRATEPGATRKYWIAYGALGVLSMHLQFFTALVIASHVVALAVNREWRAAAYCTAAGAVVALAAVPLFWIALHDANSQNSFLGTFSLKQIPTLLGTFAGNKLLWRIHVALAVVGVFTLFQFRRNRSAVVILSWTLVPVVAMLVLSSHRPLFAPRYLTEMLVPYTALTAIGLTAFRNLRIVPLIGLLAFEVWVMAHSHRRVVEDWPSVAKSVGAESTPVVFYPQIGVQSLAYYSPGIVARTVYPSNIHIESTMDYRNFPTDVSPALAKADAKLLVVVEYLEAKRAEELPGVTGMMRQLGRFYTKTGERDFAGVTVFEYTRTRR